MLFQNLFPTLNVTTVRLASCQARLHLLHLDASTDPVAHLLEGMRGSTCVH